MCSMSEKVPGTLFPLRSPESTSIVRSRGRGEGGGKLRGIMMERRMTTEFRRIQFDQCGSGTHRQSPPLIAGRKHRPRRQRTRAPPAILIFAPRYPSGWAFASSDRCSTVESLFIGGLGLSANLLNRHKKMAACRRDLYLSLPSCSRDLLLVRPPFFCTYSSMRCLLASMSCLILFISSIK